MTFSLVILLYMYYVFLVLWALASLIGLYHLVRFGGRTFGTFIVGLIYLAGALSIFYFSYTYIATINWQGEVAIFNNLTLFNNLGGGSNLFK